MKQSEQYNNIRNNQRRIRKRRRRRRRRRRRKAINTSQVDNINVTTTNYPSINTDTIKTIENLSTPAPEPIVSNDVVNATKRSVKQDNLINTNTDLRVRRAILWIKVKKVNKMNDFDAKTPKIHRTKQTNKQSSKNTHRNHFRLWVFRVVKPMCKLDESKNDQVRQ